MNVILLRTLFLLWKVRIDNTTFHWHQVGGNCNFLNVNYNALIQTPPQKHVQKKQTKMFSFCLHQQVVEPERHSRSAGAALRAPGQLHYHSCLYCSAPDARHRNGAAIFIASLSGHRINIQNLRSFAPPPVIILKRKSSCGGCVRLRLFPPAAHNITIALLFTASARASWSNVAPSGGCHV